ncbi:MAG: dltD protein, partial [Bacilli bacterium]|nr:dltD protein [Bacilli bacterium]
FQELAIQASEEGKTASNNNDFGFINDTYTKSIEPKKDSDKGAWKPGNYLKSGEYDDLQAILEILQKEHADPLFVLIPRKGAWSDFIGFSKPYREELNAKIRYQVTAAGFQVIDYTDHEYDNYFMRDTSHLGWTGWVYLDEDLLKFVHY